MLHAADKPPRWGFLGEDKDLTFSFNNALCVALVVIFDTELRNIRPPIAEVVLHATVVDIHKGNLKIGDKIKISLYTDTLDGNAETQRKFIEDANSRNKGALKFAFLHEVKEGDFTCEWLDLPGYTSDMQEFLRKIARRPAAKNAEQGADGQPQKATQPPH